MILKLGKLPYEHDPRSIDLGEFLSLDFVPESYDFDKGRAEFAHASWGNLKWQNCVTVAQANAVLRLRRIETRRNYSMSEPDVVKQYRSLTKADKAGGIRDVGLSTLQMMKDWQHNGFQKTNWLLPHKVAVYGELDPLDDQQLRQACYLLGGIFLGFALPEAARAMCDLGRWEVPLVAGKANFIPGSWGEHLVFAKKYDLENFYCLTWGHEIQVSNDFIKRYCDEAWAVVNDLARWRHNQGLDIERLLARMPQPN